MTIVEAKAKTLPYPYICKDCPIHAQLKQAEVQVHAQHEAIVNITRKLHEWIKQLETKEDSAFSKGVEQ